MQRMSFGRKVRRLNKEPLAGMRPASGLYWKGGAYNAQLNAVWQFDRKPEEPNVNKNQQCEKMIEKHTCFIFLYSLPRK